MEKMNCTPHIGAKKGEIAKRVLMPGDPKRAQWIAKTYLKNAKLVNDVRGMLAFTGYYKNVPVTVMGHGMGISSVCIYAHELYNFYGVKVIYRVGSCGVSNKAKVNVGEVILAESAWSNVYASWWLNIKLDGPNLMKPTKSCLKNIIDIAKKANIHCHLRNVTSDEFFYKDISYEELSKRSGANVYEMEGFGLFLEAKKCKRKAACLLTVSDNVDNNIALTSKERETTFSNMVQLALEAIIKERV